MIVWRWLAYDDFLPRELEGVLRARQEVFVIEQQCIYQDIDGLDADSWHLLGYRSETPAPAEIAAYLRVVAPGKKFPEPSIGRVLTAKSIRGSGVGRALMREGIVRTGTQYPHKSIRISAQAHLERFYREFGFKVVSKPYDEDGIPHVEMLRQAN